VGRDGVVDNPVPGVQAGVPSSRGYQGGFGSALMTKDLGLALVIVAWFHYVYSKYVCVHVGCCT